MKTNEGGAGFGTIGKERGKLLATAVVFAMVLAGLVIVTSEAEMSNAEPQGSPVTDYDGLSTAFTTGGSYYLANDITIESASGLNVTADVVLDLNGNTLNKTYAAQNNFIIKINGGSLTINDSGTDGKIISADYGIQLYSGSSLTINNGAIETKDEPVDIRTSAKNVNITIAGGSIKSTDDAVMNIRGDENISVDITGGAMVSDGRTAVYVSSYEENAITISMTGGSIEHHDGLSGAFQIYSGANVTIGGEAKVSSDGRTLVLQAGESQSTLNITGGTISSTGRGSAVISSEDTAKLNISGGTFEATSNKVISATEDSVVTIDGVGIEISGEMEDNASLIINEGASASIADGFEMESNNKITNNGTLDVKGEITGATASNLTGTGIVLGYEGEGFTDSTKVEESSITVTAQNFEQVMASINDNPGMYTGITVSVTENVTIDDVLNVPAGIALSIGENTITTTAEGNGIILQNGASFTGTISMGSATVTADSIVSAGELSILHGSIVFDGDVESGSAVLTSTGGEDITLTGTLNAGVQVTIVQGSDAADVPVRFDNFNDNGGTVGFQSFGSEDVSEDIPNWIEAVYAGNVTLGGLAIINDDEYIYYGTSQYPAEMRASISGMTSQGFINKTLNGLATGGSDMGVYKLDGESLVLTDAIDAGTYYVYYGYFVDSVLHTYLCEWTIQTADADITFGSIDKTYDGTTALESSDVVTLPTVSNIAFGTPVYEDMNAGEDKTVILAVEFQNGAVPGNYAFTVNGQEATILGDAENGYYVELQGSISQKEITLTLSAEMEYSGEVFEHAFSLVTGVEGDEIQGKMKTSGSDVKGYSGADITYNVSIINGETDVTANYIVVYDVSNTLTIDPKDVTVSPATGAEITKVYNGYSSRIMKETDFQMTGVIDGDDVSFAWTNSATYVKYNSSNVSDADTLTVTGISLTGEDATNYELISDTVVFEDGADGLTVGITPMVLTFSTGSSVAIDKTYDGTVAAPAEDITSDDYAVSQSQAGVQPTVTVTSAVYGSADVGTGKTVYITGIELTGNDYRNFALPELQTSGDVHVQYYFSITGDGVEIDALAVTTDMIGYEIAEVDGQIILTLAVASGELAPTGFISSLTKDQTSVSAIEGTNSYVITSAGSYTAKVTPTDSNWSGTDVEKDISIEFTYTANFYTKETIDGDYSIEQTVTGDKQIQTPNATNVPDGYVLAGWALEPNGSKVYGVNVFADVSPVNTDFYAVYEEDDGIPVGPGPEPAAEPTVTIDMPDEFVIGVETEFSVSTTRGDTTGTVYVKGTGSFEGIPGVDYNIWYLEVQDGQWHAWDGATFGPSTGFPLSDETSKFKVQFINAGAYDLTVQIVTADNGDVVCETAAVVNVPAENTLGYHIQNAVDFVYTDDPDDYNADAYTYNGVLSSSAGAIVASYGYDYYEALIADLQSNTGTMSEKTRDIMNDFARYMGALYRSADGDVGRVYFDGMEYVWKADADGAWLNGSNWRDADGDTLTEDVVLYIIKNQTTRIVMEVASNGISAEALTYSVQFADEPVIPEKVIPGISFDMPEFTAGQEGTFQVSFIANDYAGETAVVKATFGGDAGDITSVYYWNVNSKAWTIMTAEADGSYMYGGSGFPLMDATSTFKATIANAGVYTLNVEILVGGESIASKTATFVVSEPVQEPEYYSVTLRVDNSTSTVSVAAGDYIILTTPSKDGYKFDGWYVEGDESTLYNWYYTPTSDVTLVAKFTEVAAEEVKTYSVQFGEVRTYTGLEAGDVVTMPTVTPEQNYRLVGWQTENGVILTGQQYYVYAGDDADEDGTIALEPVFEKYVFTVIVTGGENGTIGTGTVTVEMGGTAVITGVAADPGYYVESIVADGGYSVVDYNGTYIIFDVADDINVTVTFAADPGAQDITMTAALTEGGVVVNMNSNDGGNLPTGTIQVVYSYTEYNEELGLEMTRFTTVEVEYEAVNQQGTSQMVSITFPATSSYAYAKFVVGEDDVRAQTGYFRTTMES